MAHGDRDKSGSLKCQRRAVTSAQSAKRPHESRPAATSTSSHLLLRRLSKCDPSDINFKRAADEERQAALLLLLLRRGVLHILMDPASRMQSCRCILEGIRELDKKYLQAFAVFQNFRDGF